MPPRRKTRQVNVGGVRIGGDAPVALQTMTSGYTYEIDKCIAEVQKLARAGADLVRVAVPNKRDTEALPHILAASPVPIVADVHFHFERAMEAIAAGVHKIRLNPGNIQDRQQVNRVIAACKERGVPIRVGVNEGGIVERRDKRKRAAEKATLAEGYTANLIRIMLAKLDEYLRIFDENDFHDVVISAKSIDPRVVIDAYTAISQRYDYPLHLGVTHAGPPETGRIRSISALGALLADGIGDTIRISYAADPVYEVEDGKELLCSLGLRPRTEPELIACPTCGRIEVDLFKLVSDVRRKLADEIKLPIKVAVMGCVVNGPGECEGADVAIFAGKGKGIIYVQGEQKQTVPEAQMLDALLAECRALEAAVQRGEATLTNAHVDVKPPDPLPRRDGSLPLPLGPAGQALPVRPT
jgi:(E)-4-hydroxy-3-methylbut-2-enyl-diphosphate synthase